MIARGGGYGELEHDALGHIGVGGTCGMGQRGTLRWTANRKNFVEWDKILREIRGRGAKETLKQEARNWSYAVCNNGGFEGDSLE